MVLCQVQLDAYPDRCFQILHRLRLRTNIFGSATVTKQSPLIRVLTLRYLLLGLLYDFIDICTVTRNTHFQIAWTLETSESWPCHLSASNYIIRDKDSRYCSSGANSVCVTNALCQVLHLSLLTLLLFSAFVLHL